MSPRSILVRESDFDLVYQELPRRGLLTQMLFEQNLQNFQQNLNHYNVHNRAIKGIMVRVFLLGLYMGSVCGFLVGFPYWKLKRRLWSWTLFKWEWITRFLARNLTSSMSPSSSASSSVSSSGNWTAVGDCEKSVINCPEEPSILGVVHFMDIVIFSTLFVYPIYYIYKIICELIIIFKSYRHNQYQ